ncbi:YdcF family protein [Ureibacillus thermosphaericus]|nr:YdcF family protein [Ureibacillus thermosphaericus]
MKKIFLIILGILIVSSVALFTWSYKTMKQPIPVADGTYEYAILLGAKVESDGRPSLTLQYRLKEAIKYLKSYPHVNIIVSGGKGLDEPISEAEAMYTFLVESGIEEYRIIREEQATSTYENLLYSKKLLPTNTKNVTLITSDFHCARAKILANKLDLEVDIVASKTPKIVEQKLHIREQFALIKTLILGK